MLQQTIGSVGPAGFLLADDSDMYERNQRGRAGAGAGVAGRSSADCTANALDDDGSPIADVTDELPQRAIWRHYRALMTAAT